MVSVKIVYCKPCGYLPEAQALEKYLKPLKDVSIELHEGKLGVFEVYVDGKLIFSKEEERRFPDPDEIRDLIANTSG